MPKFLENVMTLNNNNLTYKINISINNNQHINHKENILDVQFYYPNKTLEYIKQEVMRVNIIKEQFLSSQSKYKFGNNFFKFKSIATDIVLDNKYVDEEEKLYQNNTNKRKIDIKILENPCYIKGYQNTSKNIIGTGNYKKCYKMLTEIINKDQEHINKFFENREYIRNSKKVSY
jgi:hypothetical protein